MKNVGKILGTGLVIIWAGFYPQRTGHSQPNIAPASNPVTDSLEQLQDIAREEQEKKRRSDSAALSISKQLPGLVSKLERSVTARKRRPEQAKIDSNHGCDNVPLLSYNGDMYEIPFKKYKDYMIIDVDSFLANAMNKDADPSTDHQHADSLAHRKVRKEGTWKQVKNFFSKQFKRRN